MAAAAEALWHLVFRPVSVCAREQTLFVLRPILLRAMHPHGVPAREMRGRPQQEIYMSYQERDPYGMYKGNRSDASDASRKHGPGPALMGAHTLTGNDVVNRQDELLGDIKEIMLDTRSGHVAYAVLSFGGLLGMGDKLFAVPWSALKLDTVNERFVLDVEKSKFESAPGFDKDAWPNMANPEWERGVHAYYGTTPSTSVS